MQILVTGANGFAGHHLIRHISATTANAQIHGAVLRKSSEDISQTASITQIDLRNNSAVFDWIARLQPDQIYHLAARAFVPQSFANPWKTFENNIKAQLNIIQACLSLQIRPRILVVSSAEVYGQVSEHENPIRESCPLRPTNPYSVSKVTQDLMGLQYYLSHRLPIIRARPFNHIGPRQSENFVATAFAMQIARIEAGLQKPVLSVGNLSAKRDFTDVRDIAGAYQLIMEKGAPGEAYNVASNKARSIQNLLDILLSYSDQRIEARVDPERIRPIDIPEIRGDAGLLERQTGWRPQIPFEQSLLDVLNDCRKRVRQELEME